jgi:hypothetical protein
VIDLMSRMYRPGRPPHRRCGEGNMTTADDEQAFEESLAYYRRLLTETLNEIHEANPRISRERVRQLFRERVEANNELQHAVVMCAAEDHRKAYIKEHGNWAAARRRS